MLRGTTAVPRWSSTLACLALLTITLVPAAQSQEPSLGQAQALLDAGQAEQAKSLLDRWIKRNGKDAEARLLRSSALFLLGERDQGRADLERALELDPSLRQGWLNRAALDMADRNYDSALAALEQARRLEPAAADNDLNIGAVLLLKGDLTQAARSFQRYLDLHRISAESHYLVAANYAMAGYPAPAVDLLRRSIQLDERTRLQARTDPNFRSIADEPAYQALLGQDPQRPAQGSHVARYLFARAYTGGDGDLLPAVLDSLQLAGVQFDRRVELTPAWALVWGEIRVEIRDAPDGRGLVQFSADADAMSPTQWEARTKDLVQRIQTRLLTQAAKKKRP